MWVQLLEHTSDGALDDGCHSYAIDIHPVQVAIETIELLQLCGRIIRLTLGYGHKGGDDQHQ